MKSHFIYFIDIFKLYHKYFISLLFMIYLTVLLSNQIKYHFSFILTPIYVVQFEGLKLFRFL